MRNPLGKRLFRELRDEWKKYLAFFILLTAVIGFVSGMYVANGSMEKAAAGAYEKYNAEDAHFDLKDEATDALITKFEENDITVYPLFFKTVGEDKEKDGNEEAQIRIFKNRDEVNLACVMDGRLPEAADEIAIDRMHADNVGLSVGDEIDVDGQSFKITGLVAFSDYSTLFLNNNDIMFDALTLDVACVTPEGFERIDIEPTYRYAYRYDTRPTTDKEKNDRAEETGEKISVLAATGGMLDDKDEAKKLKENVERWKEYLEDIQMRADALEVNAAALEAKAAGMSPAELFANAAELQKERAELETEKNSLESEKEEIDRVKSELEKLEPYEENINEIKEFVPDFANRSMQFAVEDFGSDKSLGEVIMAILVVVLAFISAITISNTISRESGAIGTLRATGYTRGELVRHYIALPLIVTLVSAAIGNILGYTVLKNTVVSMYYNSYSLPKYETVPSGEAFIKTTLIPLVTMTVINLIVVIRKMRISPLRFLRGDIGAGKKKKALRLPEISFIRRFRLRILIQNLSGYFMLFVGIFFVMIMLAFSVGMPSTLENYKSDGAQFTIANYETVLKDTSNESEVDFETAAPDAERFSLGGLLTVDGVHVGEEISIYGYEEGSSYFKLENGKVAISAAYADKFGIKAPTTVKLKDKYTDTVYDIEIDEVYDLPGILAVLMPNDDFNSLFDNENGAFTGYLSDSEITDISRDNVAAVYTADDTLKFVNQLDHSLGGFMDYFSFICMAVAVILIFLLTKLIIEKNTVSISMVKILGYRNGEINSLYIGITTIVVVLFTIINAFLSAATVTELWKLVMYRMNGWFTFYFGAKDYIKIIVMVIISYLIVALIDMRRIKKIPMSEALKNTE